jgi:hypothetical protein
MGTVTYLPDTHCSGYRDLARQKGDCPHFYGIPKYNADMDGRMQ